jgi:hypothetical protein
MTQESNEGMTGALIFALGATIIFVISTMVFDAVVNGSQNPIFSPFILIAFLGFILVGIGLLLINKKR